jgi:hypothetical protein
LNPFPAWRLPNGLTKASDREIEKSIESCERWEWFGGGLVVVGVVAELAIAAWHPPYDSFLEQWGSSLANGLVALGVAFEIKLGQMAGLRQSELRRRSDEKVAVATDRAATAQAELIQFRTPRRELMNPEALASITAKLAAFPGTPFTVGHLRVDREQWDFLWVLEPAIVAANWQHIDWVGGSVFRKNAWPGNHTYGEMGVINVAIELFPDGERLRPAAEALSEALNAVGVKASVEPPNNSSINIGVVHLLVGMKQG